MISAKEQCEYHVISLRIMSEKIIINDLNKGLPSKKFSFFYKTLCAALE